MPEPALPASFLPFSALLASEAEGWLQLDKPLWMSRAPGRLKILGGPTEAPGTVTLSMPISRSVYTAIQNREDRKIRIRSLLPDSWGGDRLWEGDIDTLYTRKGPPRSMAVLKQIFSEPEDLWMMRVLAVMLGLRRTRQLNTPKKGFDILIWSRVPEGIGYGERAAFGVSLALALKGSTGLSKKRVDGILVARAVAQGFAEVLDDPIPMTDVLTSSLGRVDCALQIEHGADPDMQWIPVPPQCSFAAVDLGFEETISPEVRQRHQTGAAMAMSHLNAEMQAQKSPEYGGWGQVAPPAFEGGLRGHVPASEKGESWLKKFRRKSDAKELSTLVDPSFTYRLRANAEHECRESGRSRRLVANLNDFSRTMRETYLAEAGRCLGSSQRSFKEKCGLDLSPMSEFFKLFNESGRKGGMFGMRMTLAGGCSVFAALVHQSARQDLRLMVEEFTEKHPDCKDGTVIIGSDDGGVLRSWWEGVLEPAHAVDDETVGSEEGKKPAKSTTK
ncbi:MAG: hypothetical protein QGH51_04380 [Planctomycetota bacterium]|nr:hypothetical protein [Planctomycetota bacterium]MDP6941247.1 hypothetical protein [Planctomycetota bacterium]